MKKVIGVCLLGFAINGFCFSSGGSDFSNLSEMQQRAYNDQELEKQQQIIEELKKIREKQESDSEKERWDNSFNR